MKNVHSPKAVGNLNIHRDSLQISVQQSRFDKVCMSVLHETAILMGSTRGEKRPFAAK